MHTLGRVSSPQSASFIPSCFSPASWVSETVTVSTLFHIFERVYRYLMVFISPDDLVRKERGICELGGPLLL